jgi:uncharacterized protein DUF4124
MVPMKTLLTACMAAFLFCAAGAAAQVIFKQTDETGRTIFTDRADPAARTVAMYVAAQYKDSSAQPDDPVLRPAAATDRPMDVERALQLMAPIASARAATIDSNEAARRMRQEQRTHTKGAETLRAEPTVNDAAVAQIRARLTADRPSHRLAHIPTFISLTMGYILLALALACLAFNARRLIAMSGLANRLQH